MKRYVLPLLMFVCGGFLYVSLELLWRHHSHWSMFFVGGLCVALIDGINEKLKRGTPLWVRCTLGAAVITAVEFLSGCVLNLWAKWNVWDYSALCPNLMGQVCLLYTVFWFFLSAPTLWFTRFLRRLLRP